MGLDTWQARVQFASVVTAIGFIILGPLDAACDFSLARLTW
jgi:hypothetical protein